VALKLLNPDLGAVLVVLGWANELRSRLGYK
jgi:hypothetical protein